MDRKYNNEVESTSGTVRTRGRRASERVCLQLAVGVDYRENKQQLG